MLVELKTKVWWSERDLSHLSARFTNNNRVVSVAMNSMPSQQGSDIATYTCDSPTIMLWVLDGEGVGHDVTAGVLGERRSGEYYAEHFMAKALAWLQAGK